MHVDKITRVGYATIVEANGGENQLTVLGVPRQDGKTWLTVVASGVDSENDVILDKLVPTDSVRRVLTEAISGWHRPNAIGHDTDREQDLLKFFAVNGEEGFLMEVAD